MQILFQILLSIFVLSIPLLFILFMQVYIEKGVKEVIKTHLSDSSVIYKDVRVRFKNFDVFKRKSIFSINPLQTIYSFNNCDLILNSDSLIVIGKTKIFGKSRSINSTIFAFDNKNVNQNSNVSYKNVRDNGSDLEIDFIDSTYNNLITLVIKRIDNTLKDKIKNGLQQPV